jgi:hypothetical protein
MFINKLIAQSASIAFASLVFHGALAANASTPISPTAETKTTTEAPTLNSIALYDSPNSSGKILKQFPFPARLIPVFRQGEWLKVGDPRDGQVGWVNLQQYRQARFNYFRPDIQTVYMQVDRQDPKKQPAVNIIAYKNGQKLSDQEALELYKKIRANQEKQFQQMEQMSWRMQKEMDRDFNSFWFGNFWPSSNNEVPSEKLPATKKQ